MLRTTVKTLMIINVLWEMASHWPEPGGGRDHWLRTQPSITIRTASVAVKPVVRAMLFCVMPSLRGAEGTRPSRVHGQHRLDRPGPRPYNPAATIR